MKRLLIITILITGLTGAYGFAQMGQGRMMGPGMMGTAEQPSSETQTPYGEGYHPCPMGQGMMGGMGQGMMGPGNMGGMMKGMGPGMMGYGMGSGAYSQEEYQKYLDDTAGSRKKLHDKKFEYFETLRKGDADKEAVLKLEKEIHDLQWEIYEKAPR